DKNLRPPMPSQLHRSHPHPTRARMHQHPLLTTQPSQHRQAVPRRQKHHRHTRSLDQRPPRRHRDHQPRIHHHLSTHHPQQPHHRITDRKPADTGTNLDHNTGTLSTQLPTTGIHTQGHQHIPKVHPHRSHRHPHPARSQLYPRLRLHHQILQSATTPGNQPPSTSRQLQHRPRTRSHQPRRMHHTRTHHQLRLTTTNHRPHIHRPIRINQHHPTRILRLRRTHQPPHRRTRQIRHTLTRQTHRPTSQHNQHTRLFTSQPRLQHPQRLTRSRVHRPVVNSDWRLPHDQILNVLAAR